MKYKERREGSSKHKCRTKLGNRLWIAGGQMPTCFTPAAWHLVGSSLSTPSAYARHWGYSLTEHRFQPSWSLQSSEGDRSISHAQGGVHEEAMLPEEQEVQWGCSKVRGARGEVQGPQRP